jgi:hypothetical protein
LGVRHSVHEVSGALNCGGQSKQKLTDFLFEESTRNTRRRYPPSRTSPA